MLLDIKEIREYLPHRYPFLLVDRVLELRLVPGERRSNVKGRGGREGGRAEGREGGEGTDLLGGDVEVGGEHPTEERDPD